MKTGNLVSLRAVEENDLNQFKSWRNNEFFKRNFREYLELSDFNQYSWFSEIVNKSSNHLMFSIIDVNCGSLIGCCGLTYINWTNRSADFSFYYGRNLEYIDNEGYSLEAASILLDYGFNQLNLHKIWTEIYEFDSQKKKFLIELGFQLDGKLRDNYYYDGRYWESHFYSILISEFELDNQ
jgi:RimJ/RimL family protein N-acetyltransferase